MRVAAILIFFLYGVAAMGQEYYFRELPRNFEEDFQKISLIFQSADQMIWLGTDKGLYSFDGHQYRRAFRDDHQKKPVTAIAQSPLGEIWAGYDDGFIQVISANGIARSIDSDIIGHVPVSRILFNKQSEVIIATYGTGLWKMQSDSWVPVITGTEASGITDVYDAAFDPQGNLWIGTDLGLWKLSAEKSVRLTIYDREDNLPDEIVTTLFPVSESDIWIGFYDRGLTRYNPESQQVFIAADEPVRHQSPVRICSDPRGKTWYCTSTNIGVFDGLRHRQIKLPSTFREPLDDILIDHTGNLWVSTGGKLFLANTHLEFIYPGIDQIQSVEILNQTIWLGTDKGLFSYDILEGVLKQHLKHIHLNALSLYLDTSGLLWIGTFGQGLIIYDPASGKYNKLMEANGISNNSILNIDGRDEKVWLATLGGITEIHSSSNPFGIKPVIIDFQDKYQFHAGYVYDVYVADNGDTWFGTDGKGLFVLRNDNLIQWDESVVSGTDTIDLRNIYSIAGDPWGTWVSSGHGRIIRLDNNGEANNQIIAPNLSLNSLIAGGGNEIIVIREGALEVHHPNTGDFDFTTATGLTSMSPNLNATVLDDDGSAWIADADKILHYVPSPVDTAMIVPMHFVDMPVTFFNDSEPMRLDPDSNFLDVRFSGLWFADPGRVQYRYMLDGHDAEWIYTKEGRAVYSSLAPGSYIFRVEASYNGDFSHARGLTKEIIVMPPFYLTWWFIFGIVAVIGLLTLYVVKVRIQRLKHIHQLEKEKTSYQLNAIHAQVNPHFLFNSFNTLASIIEEDQEAAIDYVDQLAGFFRGALLHRHAELITIVDEIEIMRNYTYILNKRHGEHLKIREQFETEEGMIAPLTMQLLVENAIKHNRITSRNPLEITIHITDRMITVSNPVQPKIQDEAESTGFGLSSLLTRYQYLTKDSVEIINDGDTFTVKIPVIHSNVPV